MPDYKIPLVLRRPLSAPGQIPELGPPIAHASPYIDIVNIQQAWKSSPVSRSASPPDRKGIRLPWNKGPRPQDGIASGLATTIGFGAAAVPGGIIDNFKPISDGKSSPRK